MPADPDTLPRDYQPAPASGAPGGIGEAPELPILLRIPKVAAANQQQADTGGELESVGPAPRGLSEPGGMLDSVEAPLAPREVPFEVGMNGRYSLSEEDPYGEDPHLAFAEESPSGEKSWAEQIGSKVVLALVLLAVGGVAVVATQSGPNIDDLPELSADLYGAIEDGRVASASENYAEGPATAPIEPTEDVYGKFDFTRTDGVEPVSIEDATPRKDAPSIAQSAGDASAGARQDAEKRAKQKPTMQLAGPSGAADGSESGLQADPSAADVDGLTWPAPEPVESAPGNVASESGDFGAYRSGAGAESADQFGPVAGGALSRDAVSEPVASDAEPAETFAPLATATAGPIDWAQFDPHNRASHYGPGTASQPGPQELLAQNPEAAGHGNAYGSYRSTSAASGASPAGQPYHNVGFERPRVEASPADAAAAGYGLRQGMQNPPYGSQYGPQHPYGNQTSGPADVGYAYPGPGGVAGGVQGGFGAAPAGQASGPANAATSGYGAHDYYGSRGQGHYGAGGHPGLQHPAATGVGAVPAATYAPAGQPTPQPSTGFANPYGAPPAYGAPSAYPPQQ